MSSPYYGFDWQGALLRVAFAACVILLVWWCLQQWQIKEQRAQDRKACEDSGGLFNCVPTGVVPVGRVSVPQYDCSCWDGGRR